MSNDNKSWEDLNVRNATLVCGITDSELKEILSIFDILYPLQQIRSVYEITEEINTELLEFLTYDNLKECLVNNQKSTHEVLRTANKLILNYCISIKLLVEKVEYFSKCNAVQAQKFRTLFSNIYDKELTYRFLMRLRNYIIHNEMPFSICRIGSNKTNIYIDRRELLKWKKWNTVRKDIEEMSDEINLYPFISTMRSLMYTIYINILAYYADGLFESYLKYGELLKKYKSEDLLFSKKTFDEISSEGNEGNIIALPIGKLTDFIKELEKVPNIEISYK